MQVRYHIVTSAALSGLLYALLRSWPMSVACMAAGVLVDLDHVMDYVVQYGFKPDLKFFLSSFPEGKYRRIFILLHGWEWVLAVTAAAWHAGWPPVASGVLAGYSLHMIFDQFVNHPDSWGYFLVWRLRHKFVATSIFRKHWPPNQERGETADERR